jgi:natural product precursor
MKKLNTKLTLNKESVASLNDSEMMSVQGGQVNSATKCSAVCGQVTNNTCQLSACGPCQSIKIGCSNPSVCVKCYSPTTDKMAC